LRTLCNKITNSSIKLLPHWRSIVKNNHLRPHVLPRDVKTRWNSTYNMINVVLTYCNAIHEFTLNEENGATDYLSKEEWDILTDLWDVLLVMPLRIFSGDLATIATVIPAMDKLNLMLATAILAQPDGQEWSFHTTVQIMLIYAKKTLNRYYAKMYYNHVQRSCLSLFFYIFPVTLEKENFH
ncbi:hypothetical protein K438DRAFT_1566262, partial [Mycena galopus ATCC 62051]